MRRIRSILLSFVLVALSVTSARAQQTATLSGRITDATDGFPLVGANVVLLDAQANNMITGAATGGDGTYTMSGISPGQYVLAIRFVGYREERVQLSLSAGESRTVDAALAVTGFDLNTVVVSASRQAEKVLDAPASISVLEAEQIEATVVPSSAAILRNTTGVDMSQTGVDHYEIVLRGFNNAFSGATYVLTDYRQGAIASLGVNAYEMMPITQIDVDRIEVVRGPGSALYGAGVDAGVIHFMSKDPFTYPGTTLTVGGGERSLLMGSVRHAGVLNGRIGYKLVGNFSRADEWEFDPNDPQDKVQLESFRPEALPVDYNQHKANLSGTLAYRFRPNMTLTANGGFSTAKSIFLSGIGTLQSEGFGYTFGQLRLQAGNFFAQTFVNRNNTGDSFVYATGAVSDVIDNSVLFNTQAQYDFNLAADRLRVIAGADFELTSPDTKGTINGRNEDDDQVIETGAYAQATYVLHPRLDATVALRGDYNNVVENFQLSPRAALVYKPLSGHSIRGTYNRAFSSPGINSLFLDIVARRSGPLTIRARGSAEGFHFRDVAGGHYVASSLLSYNFGSTAYIDQSPITSEGMRLAPLYAAVYGSLKQLLSQPNAPLPPPLNQLTPEQRQALVQLLDPSLTAVEGFVPARLGYINLTKARVEGFSDSVVDIPPLEQTISQTFEIGYKGILGKRVLIAADVYHVRKKNFVGPLLVETPFVMVPAIGQNFLGAITSGIAGNPNLMEVLRQMQQAGYIPPNIPVEQAAAGLIVGLAASGSESLRGLFEGKSSVSDTHSPIAIVQPVENVLPGELLLAYRNFGELSYSGVDLSSEVIVSDRLNVFGNMSWVSDNFFDADELDEEGTDLELSMNAPKIKVRGGFDYAMPRGLRFNSAVRYVGSFEVRSGPYQDNVPAFTLLDVGAGYDLSRYADGLRFDVTVLNVLNEKHRQFVGAPQMGRLAMARVTYNL